MLADFFLPVKKIENINDQYSTLRAEEVLSLSLSLYCVMEKIRMHVNFYASGLHNCFNRSFTVLLESEPCIG